MSKDQAYSLEQIVGDTSLPRISHPTLRGTVRRSDADALSPTAPYWPGLSGKYLTLQYTKANLATDQINVAFTDDSLVETVAAINASAPGVAGDILATDVGGYLEIITNHSGSPHTLAVLAYSVPANDAAPILGFPVQPFPGSMSYAGDLVTSPPAPTQGNAPGTGLLARGEDLSSESINRAIFSVASRLEALIRNLGRETVTVTRIGPCATEYRAGVGTFAKIDDADVRLPTTLPSGLRSTAEMFRVVDPDGSLLINPTTREVYQASAVFHGTLGSLTSYSANAVSAGQFATPGAAAHTIYGDVTPGNPVTKVRKPVAVAALGTSIAITSIVGNVIYCEGAQFQTALAQPGDTLIIEGISSTTPFSHNGEFVVSEVLDEEHIAVRRKSDNEPLVDSSLTRPAGLNPDGDLGSVAVPIGYFIPAKNVGVKFATANVKSTYPEVYLNVMTGALPESADKFANAWAIPDGIQGVIDSLVGHITTDNPSHPASTISIGTRAGKWADSTTDFPNNNRLDAQLHALMGVLASTSGTAGSGKIGAAEILGSTVLGEEGGLPGPFAASGANVHALIKSVLKSLNDHANLPVHATTATIGGYAQWLDGNPSDATSLDHDSPHGVNLWISDTIATLVSTVAAHSGADALGCSARGTWTRSGKTNPSSSIRDAIQLIITDLSAIDSVDDLDGASKIGSKGRGTTAGGTLDALITARSIGDMLDAILGTGLYDQKVAVLSKINSFTQPQAFASGAPVTLNDTLTANEKITAEGGAVVGGLAASPTLPVAETLGRPDTNKRRLWWLWKTTASTYLRAYTAPGGLEFTRNAVWSGDADGAANWDADDTAMPAHKWTWINGQMTLYYKASGMVGSWAWSTPQMTIDPWMSATPSTANSNSAGPHTLVKAQGRFYIDTTSTTGGTALQSGNNIASFALSSETLPNTGGGTTDCVLYYLTVTLTTAFASKEDMIISHSFYDHDIKSLVQAARTAANVPVHAIATGPSTVVFTRQASKFNNANIAGDNFLSFHVTGVQ